MRDIFPSRFLGPFDVRIELDDFFWDVWAAGICLSFSRSIVQQFNLFGKADWALNRGRRREILLGVENSHPETRRNSLSLPGHVLLSEWPREAETPLSSQKV